MHRTVDSAGRIVIPKDAREALGWGDGTRLAIAVDSAGQKVILQKAEKNCLLCGGEGELVPLKDDFFLCKKCLAQFK